MKRSPLFLIGFSLLALLSSMTQDAPCSAPPAAKSVTAKSATLPDTPLLAPAHDTVWTATRETTCLAFAPDGILWAGTQGGVLHRDVAGAWRKWTRLDGLPSHEIRVLQIEGTKVQVTTPRGAASFDGRMWRTTAKAGAPVNTLPIQATWRGNTYTATLEGLHTSLAGKKLFRPVSAFDRYAYQCAVRAARCFVGGPLWRRPVEMER